MHSSFAPSIPHGNSNLFNRDSAINSPQTLIVPLINLFIHLPHSFTHLTLKSVYHPAVWCNQPHRRISSNLCFSYSLYFPAAAVCSGVKNFIHYGIRSPESDTPVRGSRKRHPGGTTCGDDEGCRRDLTSMQIKSPRQWRAKGQHKSTAVGFRSEKDPAKQKSGQ